MKNGFRFNSCFATWAVVLLLLSGAAGAQDQTQIQVDTAAKPVEPAGLDIRENAVLLSLDEAVEVALRQNLGLAIQRYTRNRARLGVDQTLGIYDLLASGTAYTEELSSPVISTFEASESNLQRFNFDVDQLLPLGGTVGVGVSSRRSESNSPFARVNPGFSAGLEFSFNQPLLRDFGRLATERGLLVALNRSQASRDEFERQLVTIVQDVIDAYWSLVGARQQLIVAQESLSLAGELHDRNKIQVDVGTMAPLELVQSEAAIAEREEGIITAQAAVGDGEDALRRLLNLPAGELWETEIRPVTDSAIQHTPIDVEAAIRTAFEERPELHTQQLDIEQARIERDFAVNQERPTLDLDLTYGYSGVGGDVIIRDEDTGQIIDTIPGGYSDALDQVTGLDFRGWTAQLTFGYPLQNRGARAARAIAEIDLERAETAFEDAQKGIITEVRQAARRVETAAKQIDAARASKVFQERNLDAERKRYENGMSTSFQITQIQEDLTEARSREVNAVVNYRTALADYQRVIGRLLEEEGISIADEEAQLNRWQYSLRGR
ncbi:MAG TPA: TolC family protein [Thermoanaerobaculia bacterium]|nr:TolC family protein [Thermoanaerobaculia bacterium]